jgi:hypothetical protein
MAGADGRPTVMQPDPCVLQEPAKFIHAISSTRNLYRFDPMQGAFERVGTMACSNDDAHSMAVDRAGTAYVLLTPFSLNPNGELYRMNTVDASCEKIVEYQPRQRGFSLFGMGFSGNDTGFGETLYVMGGGRQSARGLAVLDTESFKLTYIGSNEPTIERSELAGTDDGRLFAFFTFEPMGGMWSLGEIDKTTGRLLSEKLLTEVPPLMGEGAWATAFWRGDFYFFTAVRDTQVTRYRPSDESYAVVGTLQGVKIVGAGVSTCPER